MSARLSDLQRMREVLWESVSEAPADKRAPLIARLESVVQQIDQLTSDGKAGDPVDEIAQRRAARGAGTAASRSRTAGD